MPFFTLTCYPYAVYSARTSHACYLPIVHVSADYSLSVVVLWLASLWFSRPCSWLSSDHGYEWSLLLPILLGAPLANLSRRLSKQRGTPPTLRRNAAHRHIKSLKSLFFVSKRNVHWAVIAV